MPADTRRGGALVTTLALLTLTLLAGGAAAERRQQDCFCTGLWACIARTGLPYSECDQTGMRVICCVRRSAPATVPGPMVVAPTPDPPPAPSPANNEVAVGEAEVLRTDADTHFRYSAGRPTGRTAAISTTALPATIYRHAASTTPRSAPTSTPLSYTATPSDEEDDDADEEDEDETISRTSSSPLSTTPRAVTTTARPSRPRPSSRPAARPFAVFVTPVPAQHRVDAAQEIEWDDGAPHSNWSEEEAVEISRVGGVALQQREPKKIDWNNLSRKHGQQAGRHSNAAPPPAPKDAPKDVAVPWSSWRECGRKGADSGRDGVAEPSEWPWHAALLETASDRYVCGATLVGPTWLLTAAHCIVDYPDPSALKVRVGELDVRSDSESFTQERAVVQVVAHPAFDLASLRHDIAMVRIARPPRDHRNVAAVCLPPPAGDNPDQDDAEDFPQKGTVCVVTGWGRKDEVSPHSEVLKEVPVPIWSRGPCQEALRAHLGPSFQLPRTALCAGAKGRDACDGDGGGPMVCRTAGRWYQMGIVSYGIGCGRNNSPGVYTKLSSYSAWVRGVVAGGRDAAAPTSTLAPVNRVPAPHSPHRPTQQSPASRNAPGPSRPSPRNLVHHLPGPAVSRVRVNHYTGPGPSSTTPRTTTSAASKAPTRSVVVLSSDQDETVADEEEDEEDSMEAVTHSDDGPASPAASTTATPSTATPSTATQRSSRAMWQQHNATLGGQGSHSAGVSFFRSTFGSSGWNYPLEGHKASATVTSVQSVTAAPGQAGQAQRPKWYSPSYSGSYRGVASGARLPGQILSNVAGRTVSGLNRWYSPFYSGSYRGDYNAFPKGERDDAAISTAAVTPSTPSTTAIPRASYKVRPPLAAPRWFAPLHEEAFQGRSWYTSYHNGTIRTGYSSGLGGNASSTKHRFGAASSNSQTEGKDKEEDKDRTWTFLVKTGAKGTSITLDSSNSSQVPDSNASSSANSGTGLQGEGTSYSPYVAEQGARQGRTLVNFTNTFTYPSAQHRNTSHARGASRAAPSGLSSSYSIYRIYPSVYNTEYRAASSPRGRDPKALDGPVKTPAQVVATVPETSRNSIVGYSHFSTGSTAVNFNITHEPSPSSAPSPAPAPAPALAQDRSTPPPPAAPAAPAEPTAAVVSEDVPVVTTIAALDLTTLRAATAEDSTMGGEGMDVPPVSFISTTEPDSSAPTATPSITSTPTESVTATSTEYTTRDVMTTTTEADAVSRGRGRARARSSAEDIDGSAEAEERKAALNTVSTVSTLARRGGHQADQDSLFAPRRRPESVAEGLEATWGDKTARRGRGQGSRGGRRLETPGHATDNDSTAIMTPSPRARSRGRSRPQHQEQPQEAVSFISRKPVPTATSRVVNKERVFNASPVRHSRPVVDAAVHPDTAFVHPVQGLADADAARAFRARGRRPSGTASLTAAPTPPPPPPPTPTGQDSPEVMQFVAEVKPPRARGRNRKNDSRRRSSSAAIPQQAVHEVGPEVIFAPASTASPAPPRYQPQRAQGKKPRKQLKKVSLASGEVQEPLETAYASSPASPRLQHAWGPVVTESYDDVLLDFRDEGLEHRDDAVEDLERDDIYSFLSQRAKRRRGKGSPALGAEPVVVEPLEGGLGGSAGGAAAIADPLQSPQAPRWGRKGPSTRRRGPADE